MFNRWWGSRSWKIPNLNNTSPISKKHKNLRNNLKIFLSMIASSTNWERGWSWKNMSGWHRIWEGGISIDLGKLILRRTSFLNMDSYLDITMKLLCVLFWRWKRRMLGGGFRLWLSRKFTEILRSTNRRGKEKRKNLALRKELNWNFKIQILRKKNRWMEQSKALITNISFTSIGYLPDKFFKSTNRK